MLIVQKYGGTSVGTIERIKNVARRVAESYKEGNQVVVVVSAMAGETDRLIKLARELSLSPDDREMDMLLSSGERVSIALLAMALSTLGCRARSFTGRQVGIITDEVHTKARIERIEAQRLKEALAEGVIPIVAGFQGINRRSDVTTLGRGGSDTTALALAAALSADRCDIYTDVEGVFTCDPNLVPAAKRLAQISYEEMLEMSSLGAKVLQPRAVVFAMKYGVPVRVRSSFSDREGTRGEGTIGGGTIGEGTIGEGTIVCKEDRLMEEGVVSSVTYDKNQAKVTLLGVPDRPGVASRVFGVLADENVVVDMIVQNISQDGLTDISFTVARQEARKATEVMRKMLSEIGAKDVSLAENIAKVSIIGVGMRSHSGVAAKMFATLAREGINILMISTSEIKISCVVDAKYTELAVRSLHEAFIPNGEGEEKGREEKGREVRVAREGKKSARRGRRK